MQEIKRGVAICHYNRILNLDKIIQAVKETTSERTKIVVCDDGSEPMDLLPDHNKYYIEEIINKHNVILIKGPNLGVAANKNRALWGLQDCHYLCILEDDLIPTEKGWFEAYEKASMLSGCHHFCRVQDKEINETVPAFTAFMQGHGITPVFASSPRGDLTFLTKTVLRKVGAFNPKFKGVGYAHGEWSQRVANAGLIGHPLKWIDIKEGRDKIDQIGDREGGRWEEDEKKIKNQLKQNSRILKELNDKPYTHHPLLLQ